MANLNMTQMYQDLVRCQQKEDYGKGLIICNKILSTQDENIKVHQCKVVFQIHLGLFSEALKGIKDHSGLSKALIYEKAYCEYRLNMVDKCIETLQKNPLDSKNNELLAQALYRLERYSESCDMYLDMIKNSEDEYEDERETNLSAVLASMNSNDSNENKIDIGEQTFELCYNKACISLSDGKYDAALKQLTKSEGMCRKTLEEEGCNDEEIDTELGIIKAQIGFAYQRSNKEDVALRMYSQILKQKPTDSAVVAVISNNIVAINKDQNIFDSKKKIKAALNEIGTLKLNNTQKTSILLNNCLLLMQTNQNDLCRNHLDQFRKTFPAADHDANQIEISILYKEKYLKKAVELAERLCEGERNSLSASLTLGHILLLQGRNEDALKFLRGIQNQSYKLSIVSAIIAILLNMKNEELVTQVLKESIDWYKLNKPHSSELKVLLREGANLFLQLGNSKEAVNLLLQHRKADPTNTHVLAQLIAAYSTFDAKKAMEITRELPPIESLIASVDIDVLEMSNWSLGAKYVKKSGQKMDNSPVIRKEIFEKKTNKKKKSRIPKNSDPNVDPDPERWLPKWQRSTYRKKKDKRNATSQLKGTQGAVAGDPDFSTKPSPKPGQTNQSSPHPASRQQKIAQKKKKKGGRR